MKKKVVYIILTAAIAAAAFTAGKVSTSVDGPVINLEDVRGWESWETTEEVGIEIQTETGDYTITKEPYTVGNVTIK